MGGLPLCPLFLFGYFLWALNQGLERWTALVWYRLVWPLGGTAAIVCLYALDALTLAAACSVFIAGALLSVVPLLGALRGVERLRFDPAMAREAVRFGLPAWIGQLAYHANISLDQLLMIRLVDSRELGLYAVAVTVGYFSLAITGPLQVAIVPRSARGEAQLVVRAARSILWLIAALSVVVAALAPIFLPLLFGRRSLRRSDGLDTARGGITVDGHHGVGSSIERGWAPGVHCSGGAARARVMIPALVLLLPSGGGIAAAAISLVGYSINFGVQLGASKRVFGGSLSNYLRLHGDDVRWLYGRLRTFIARERTA